ncbi:MAG: HupE/UreJ family protein [Gloeobacteraceae cyanobacterium ES-bin-316]|nr:HupE/UreJ family protein [Ferruginibacter sp.]
MNDFAFYFDIGWKHIISADALDHQLFILALSAIYLLQNWKQVLVLVTAFTIGHSLTLFLSAFAVISIKSEWVEFFIPLTIVITALLNFTQKDFTLPSWRLNYFLALAFGLVHGLGFANNIRFMLASDQGIALPLFGFNVGLEAGQILVVAFILLMSYALVNKAGLPRKWWVGSLSAIAMMIGAYICLERWPF